MRFADAASNAATDLFVLSPIRQNRAISALRPIRVFPTFPRYFLLFPTIPMSNPAGFRGFSESQARRPPVFSRKTRFFSRTFSRPFLGSEDLLISVQYKTKRACGRRAFRSSAGRLFWIPEFLQALRIPCCNRTALKLAQEVAKFQQNLFGFFIFVGSRLGAES
jgi:hypothetical protein